MAKAKKTESDQVVRAENELPAGEPLAVPDPFADLEDSSQIPPADPGDEVAVEPKVDFPAGSHDEPETQGIPDRAREAIEDVTEEDNEGPRAAFYEAESPPGPKEQGKEAAPASSPSKPRDASTVSPDDGQPYWTTILIKQGWGYELKKVALMTRSEAYEMVRRNEWNRAGGAIIIQGERIL